MTASRGDTKPCTSADCVGTMRFGRRRDNDARTPGVPCVVEPTIVAMDDKGWVCNSDPAHFRQER
jgi:hypothetical protein